jgi:hypothetical protein
LSPTDGLGLNKIPAEKTACLLVQFFYGKLFIAFHQIAKGGLGIEKIIIKNEADEGEDTK